MMSGVISVFGATGLQGGAVINAILREGTFVPRAITRNPESEAALKLKARGIQVTQADLWDKNSIKDAITDSECVFGVTNWADPSTIAKEKGEFEQGKNLVDACRDAGIKFLVWSSLPSSKQISGGKYSIPHFERGASYITTTDKAEVDFYLKQSGLPHACIYTSLFAENIWNFNLLARDLSGSLELSIPRLRPEIPIVFTWVEKDLGPSVLALFKNYGAHIDEIWNHTFLCASPPVSCQELCDMLSKAIGEKIVFCQLDTGGSKDIDETYDFLDTCAIYSDCVIPDHRLVALGVHFHHMQEFAAEAAMMRNS